jgi:hypothetical protein
MAIGPGQSALLPATEPSIALSIHVVCHTDAMRSFTGFQKVPRERWRAM